MAKTIVKIPNFISGVSQQIPELRFPSQMEEQINGLPSIKNGFGKRYPAEHRAKLPSSVSTFNQWHWIDRGSLTNTTPWSDDWSNDFGDSEETSQYAIAFGNQTIAGVNLKGRTEGIVEVGDSLEYLETKDPENDLDFITVEDFTFVLNKKKEVKMKTELDEFRPFEALIFVAEARTSSKYHIYINDVQQATFTSGTTTSTVDIAIDLAGDLTTNLDPTEFNVVRNGSTIYIGSLTGVDFNIRTEEGDGENTLKVFKDETDDFSDLPHLAVNGFRIKIVNDQDFDEDDFWVEYEADSVTDQGRWKESRQDGLANMLDPTTMPHQLIHNNSDIWSDDWSDEFGIQTFSLAPISWANRLVGDETTVPPPSFVNKTINDIFFMRNRLGFVSGENTIQSEDGESFNFWRTTLQSILDTDPIDVGTSHTKSSVFVHAVPAQERLLLFSSDTQFIYGSGDQIVSPKTVFINPNTEVNINPLVRPFVVSSSVFFAVNKKKGTSIKELTTSSSDDLLVPQDITSHVPDYIPEDLKIIEGSNVDNMLFFVSNKEPGSIYVYKFLNEGDERVLSAFTKWTFETNNFTVDGVKGLRDNVYMINTYSDGKYLQSINLTPDYLNTGLGHPLLLDRLVNVKGQYNSTTNLTTWSLPYADSSELKVVLDESFTVPGSELQQSKITRPTTSSVAYPGDWTVGQVYIGKKYRQSTILTQPMLKSLDNGAPVVDRTAKFTVHGLTIDFYKSSGFAVDVTYKDGTVRTYKYSGYISENTNFTVGEFNFNSDSWNVPIRVKGGRKVTVEIYNDGYVPFNVYSGRWIMNLTRKKGRI